MLEKPIPLCLDCESYSQASCKHPKIATDYAYEPLFFAVLKCGENRTFFKAIPHENPRPIQRENPDPL